MKFGKFFKRTLCIFLAVMMLFFGVSNSYFSPHKMDNVEATAAVAAVAISADVIIKLIAAIGVTCLGAAIIDHIIDWDWNAICNDVHDWCREHVDILEQYVTDGTSALKEWALADEWEVIEGGGGSPEPSPDPDDDNNKKFSEKIWGANDVWNIGNLIAGAGVLSTEFYNNYVPQDEGIVEVAKAYVSDKVSNFETATPVAGTDPITESLQAIYEPVGDIYYDGNLSINVDGNYIYSVRGSYDDGTNITILNYSGSVSSKPFAILSGDMFNFFRVVDDSYTSCKLTLVTTTYNNYTGVTTTKTSTNAFTAYDSYYHFSLNVPVFTSIESAEAYIKYGDDSACINKVLPRKYNYISTDDDYGWASTADLSPADLAQANPALADDLIGRDVSISSLVAAINALKKQLEDQNPNTSTGGASADPVPYPDVPTYTVIVNEVVSDPDIFPETNPGTSTDPGTEPGTSTDPDAETGKDYTGLLGMIIGLLQQILQAIKDFMSWFVIDFPAIKAHLLEALDSVPGADGLDPFLAIITDIKGQITDHYDYPKITIQTPEILVQFVKAPEIVLLDFKDYAEYFIWVRTAMAFAILFGFAMWCVRDIKVELTLN